MPDEPKAQPEALDEATKKKLEAMKAEYDRLTTQAIEMANEAIPQINIPGVLPQRISGKERAVLEGCMATFVTAMIDRDLVVEDLRAKHDMLVGIVGRLSDRLGKLEGQP